MRKICASQKLPSLHADCYSVVDGWYIFLCKSVVYGYKLRMGSDINPIDAFEKSDDGKNLIYVKPPLSNQELVLLRCILERFDYQGHESFVKKKTKQHNQVLTKPSRLSLSDMVIVINQNQPGNKHVCSERVVLADEYFNPQDDQIFQNGSLYKWGDEYWCYWKKLFYTPRPHNTQSSSESFWIEGYLRQFFEKSIFLLCPHLIKHLWKSRT